MTENFAKKKIVTRLISKLKPHLRQGVFCAHSEKQIDDLAESLAREKLNCPVEITPDGTIICGHGRVAAAKRLGWTSIHCWVRHDLVEQGQEAVFRRLVEDNLHRRQLTKIGLGRAYLALKEQEYDRWLPKDQEQARGDFRDYLGELLGCDGTTAERWAKLAVLPIEYDQLIESGLLSQQQATRIRKTLPGDMWVQLATKMLKVMDADLTRKDKKRQIKKILENKLGRPKTAKPSTSISWSTGLCRVLDKVLQQLPESVLLAIESSKDGHGGRRSPASKTSGASGSKRPRSLRIKLDEDNRKTLEKTRAVIGVVLSAADSNDDE